MSNGKRKKTIILTGGGSAGHVIPNLLLLQDLLDDGWDVHYLGSRNGIENKLARREGVSYHTIQAGKLRRYFDIQNIFDPFKVLAGFVQSIYWVAKLRPRVIFSKGGFVAVPVIFGGWLLRTPSLIHESDMSPGLANKLCLPFTTKICVSFKKTITMLPAYVRRKTVYTGAPVRAELAYGDASEGHALCGFTADKPVLLVTGGSQGSENLNRVVRLALPELLKTWNVAHLCGSGKTDGSLGEAPGYVQFEYVGDEMAHLYKISRAAVSRAGSNTIFELLALKIPSVLVPLPLNASRGDQMLNAAEFERSGYCLKLDDDGALTADALVGALLKLSAGYVKFIDAMSSADVPDAKSLLLSLIRETAGL